MAETAGGGRSSHHEARAHGRRTRLTRAAAIGLVVSTVLSLCSVVVTSPSAGALVSPRSVAEPHGEVPNSGAPGSGAPGSGAPVAVPPPVDGSKGDSTGQENESESPLDESPLDESPSDEMAAGRAQAAPDLIEVLKGTGDHTVLIAVLERLGADRSVADSAGLTIFAPRDDAFDRYFAQLGIVADDLGRVQLERLVERHIMPGFLDSATFAEFEEPNEYFARANPYWMTEGNEPITVAGGMIDGIPLSVVDIEAANGWIHIPAEVIVPPPVDPDDNDAPIGLIIDLTIADLERYWDEVLPPVYGVAHRLPAAIVPYNGVSGELPACGDEALDRALFIGNAFYCFVDDLLAWDNQKLFPQLHAEYGDFAVATVIAHEWGHFLQALAGVDRQGDTIFAELQADCLAGSWAGSVDRGESSILGLAPEDLDEVVGSYVSFGDSPGTTIDDPDAHGSGFDRVAAFADGVNRGPGACVGYIDAIPLVVAPRPEDTTPPSDFGFDDLVDVVPSDLNDFWASAYPLAVGQAWDPVDRLVIFDPLDDLPRCSEIPVIANIAYCACSDEVLWNGPDDARPLLEGLGDGAAVFVLAKLWGRAAVAKAGATPLDPAVEDCFAGAYFASVFNGARSWQLAPGDLDELVMGLVEQPSTDPEPADGHPTFDRLNTFLTGFLAGPLGCAIPQDGATPPQPVPDAGSRAIEARRRA